MQKFDVYLFDFDGTLFDTLSASKYIFTKSYEHIGFPILESDILGFTREPIPISYARIGAPKEKLLDFYQQLEHHVNSPESIALTQIYPDTYETLIDLKILEAELGIVTSNHVKCVKSVLQKFNMQTYFFSALVGIKEAPKTKPDPSPILKALEMLAYEGDKQKICYVGDSLNDCKAAIKAGIVPILLDRDHEYPNTPYLTIHSLKELLV
ncbi:MAG: HAD family hydrolase [Erysipelotrichia bacterium]|nr:HAD family hydrolase [Erysipelotrichia bacterium]